VPSCPVATGADVVRVLDEPAATAQERVAPETMTRDAFPEIQEAEETGASLSQGAAGGKAQALELACTLWAVGHTPRVLVQGRKNSRRQTPSRIPLYSY
jgi:hypothetical protein